MAVKNISLALVIVAVLLSCKGNNQPQSSGKNLPKIIASGAVRGGYRYVTVDLNSDPAVITVFRGDYIKFKLVNQKDPTEGYQLSIPTLGVASVLKNSLDEQPYFKMKRTGEFPFTISEQTGVIKVVELKQAEYREISAEEAWKLLHDNPPFLLDVRTKNEFRTGFIKGATLIPLQELQQRTGELEQYKNQPILIYCATGNRSTTASKILLDHGYKNIMNLRMGIVGWGSKGYMVQF